jgi:hypothetical protein
VQGDEVGRGGGEAPVIDFFVVVRRASGNAGPGGMASTSFWICAAKVLLTSYHWPADSTYKRPLYPTSNTRQSYSFHLSANPPPGRRWLTPCFRLMSSGVGITFSLRSSAM